MEHGDAAEYELPQRDRLPSFAEVLSRRTKPPVDLYMLYLFLQREGAEDVLDFWLDVQQHENLCRAYFKDIRKSGRTVKEDWPQYWDYARRRGSIYGTVIGPGVGMSKRSTASTGEMLDDREKAALANAGAPPTDEEGRLSPGGGTLLGAGSPVSGKEGRGTPWSFHGRLSSTPGPTKASTAAAPTVIPRDGPITRVDLIRSAERLYLRYLVPGAPKEIYLPPALRIHSFPLSAGSLPHPQSPAYEAESAALAQVPDMFHAQKEYVFRAMEQEAFPRFLRAKAFGNLTPVSALVRLIAGLVALWAGLATAFALVFLDVKPKSVRFYLFIPFTIAVLLLVSHQYELDPILVFLKQSESTPFRTLRIREPYVGQLLLGRALWVTLVVALLVAALTLLFWAVPGHRL
ncbi:regulator of G protein signaling [Auricularia subglabra TFB-10046 SS5]|uniref:Regulator of G protein signaling n=1 Tax=Auricularia subglabra (strain TFB-10046 / SS5) TaxID=717982 RepID=J0D2L6_AURST|nr:regulator of G protein signaling [Auricularia subglabra TFB-10046 SS5]